MHPSPFSKHLAPPAWQAVGPSNDQDRAALEPTRCRLQTGREVRTT